MKETVKVRRRKLNFIKLLLILLGLYIFIYIVYLLIQLPIKNIYIYYESEFPNMLLKDQMILEEAKIDDYPSFFLTTSYSIRKRLLKNPYIKKVEVKKKWFREVHLYITKYKKIFYDEPSNKIVLENNKQVKNNKRINYLPVLINYVPDTIYDKFLKQMSLIKSDVKIKISEIQYNPHDIDEECFIFMMNDGVYVYLTLDKFNKINEYNNIVPILEGKKGILYLDLGNYFEIFE
ncbi:MAG: cell division protein FtsQ/DivIB [Bacilli bacterium]|jgi:cell division septal protein FtsQ